MELVRQFSSEVNSIYDGKLPVSRAKMTSITRSAIKAIKNYKHVVMTVEKFISKCSPEYKLPGLYVVDSIVRQSRHQFGTEKDVYGPRFSKNLEKTFKNLFMCTQSDQPKVMRVLNLWQKNEVFSTTLIQKLMALAPNPDATPSSTAPAPSTGIVEDVGGAEERGLDGEEGLDLNSANAIIQQQQSQIQALLQQQQQLQLQAQANTLFGPTSNLLPTNVQAMLTQQALVKEQEQQEIQQPPGDVGSGLSQVEALASLLQQAQQLQQVQSHMTRSHGGEGSVAPHVDAPEPPPVFNTALLDNDFDYSSEEEGGSGMRSMGRMRESRRSSIHSSPPFEAPGSRNVIPPRSPPRNYPRQRDMLPQSPPEPSLPSDNNDRDAIIKKLEQQIFLHQQKHRERPQSGGKDHRGLGPGYPEEQQSHQGVLPFAESPNNHVHGPPPSQAPPSTFHQDTGPFAGREEYPNASRNWRQGDHRNAPSGGAVPPPPMRPPPSHHPGGPQHGPPPSFFSQQQAPPPLSTPSPPPPSRKSRFQQQPPPSPPGPARHAQSISPPRRTSSDFWPDKNRDRDREMGLREQLGDRDKGDRMDRDRERGGDRVRGDRDRERDRGRGDRGDRDRERRDRDRGDQHRSRLSRSSPHRGRSRSRSPISHSPMSRRSPYQDDREKEKERKRKGIPTPRSNHVSVCTCTLWVGHLPKNIKHQQIKESFEDYGQVESVDVVAARGCAYVVMVHRSDAVRARQGLRDIRLGGQTGKIAWAPGRGVKGSTYRSFWILDEGVSYIPWNKVSTQRELASLAEGGWIDPVTCPPGMEPPVKGDDQSSADTPAPPLPTQPLPAPPGVPGAQHPSIPQPPGQIPPQPPGQVPPPPPPAQPPGQTLPPQIPGQVPPPPRQIMAPGMQQPSMQHPNVQQPGIPQAGMQQPSMQQPGIQQQPGMQQPGIQQQPGMQQQGIQQQPSMQQPGIQQQPGMQQPGIQQQPSMQQPGMRPPLPGGRPPMNVPPVSIPHSHNVGGNQQPPMPPHSVHAYSQAPMMTHPHGPRPHSGARPGFGPQQHPPPSHMGRPHFDHRLPRPDYRQPNAPQQQQQPHGPGHGMYPRDGSFPGNHRRPPPPSHMHQQHHFRPGGQAPMNGRPPRGHFGPPQDHPMHRPPPRGYPMQQQQLPPHGYRGPGARPTMPYPPDGDGMRMPPPGMAIGIPPPDDRGRRVSPPGEGIFGMDQRDENAPPYDSQGDFPPAFTGSESDSAPVVSGHGEEDMEEQGIIQDEDMSLDEEEEGEDAQEQDMQETWQAPPHQSLEITQETNQNTQESHSETDQVPLESDLNSELVQESNRETEELGQDSNQDSDQALLICTGGTTQSTVESVQETKEPPEAISIQPISQELSPTTSPAQQVPSESLDSVDIDAMLDNVEQEKPSDLPSAKAFPVPSLSQAPPASSSPLLPLSEEAGDGATSQKSSTTIEVQPSIPKLPGFMANLSPITPEHLLVSSEDSIAPSLTGRAPQQSNSITTHHIPAPTEQEGSERLVEDISSDREGHLATGEGGASEPIATDAGDSVATGSGDPIAIEADKPVGTVASELYVTSAGEPLFGGVDGSGADNISYSSLEADRGSSCNPSIGSLDPSAVGADDEELIGQVSGGSDQLSDGGGAETSQREELQKEDNTGDVKTVQVQEEQGGEGELFQRDMDCDVERADPITEPENQVEGVAVAGEKLAAGVESEEVMDTE